MIEDGHLWTHFSGSTFLRFQHSRRPSFLPTVTECFLADYCEELDRKDQTRGYSTYVSITFQDLSVVTGRFFCELEQISLQKPVPAQAFIMGSSFFYLLSDPRMVGKESFLSTKLKRQKDMRFIKLCLEFLWLFIFLVFYKSFLSFTPLIVSLGENSFSSSHNN